MEIDSHICENVLIAKFPHFSSLCAVENTHSPDQFVSFVELAPSFTTNPLYPFYVLEGSNTTFVWQYNLDGTFGDVVFQFTGSTASLPIVDKFDLNLDAAVPESVYRVAFKKTLMLHAQKLRFLHCKDRRVENTKLYCSKVIAGVPETK